MVRAGTTLGDRYLLQELVAGGGMGDVWRGEDTVLGRTVAVKVLLPALSDDSGFAARFRAEARAMAALSHPGIVEVYDYGHADRTAYLVMQYVRGDSLRAVLDRLGQLDPEDAMQLVAEVADALHAAHVSGIVHRDVKPANLLIRDDGRVVLTDFGIARVAAADGLTEVGTVLGTASYLAPEQVTGGPVTPATDVYALGVVAYECLAGHRPFVAQTPIATALLRLETVPPALPPDIPAPIRQVVDRALAREPAGRWPSAAAMAQAATAAKTAALEEVTVTLPPKPLAPPPPRPPAPGFGSVVRRRRLGLVIGAAAVLIVVAGVVALQILAPPGADGQATPTTEPSSGSSTVGTGPSGAAGTGGVPRATPTRRPGAPGDKPPVGSVPTPPGSGSGAPPPPPPTTPAPTPTVRPPTLREVPKVLKLDEGTARQILTDHGFKVEVTYQKVKEECWVLSQDPGPGVLAQVGSVVSLVVGDAIGPCRI